MSGRPVDGLRKAIRGRVLQRHDPGFDAAVRVFNTRFDHVRPRAAARPVDGADVRDAVRFSAARDVQVDPHHYFNFPQAIGR